MLDKLEQLHKDIIYDHVFETYTNRPPSEEHHLGYVDRTGDSITVTLPQSGIDLHLKQSLSAFNSSKQTSSTGYVCWQTSIYMADWLLSDRNSPFKKILDTRPTVLELGAGSSGVLASIIGPMASTYVATDHQKHLCKLLKLNVEINVHTKVNFDSDRSSSFGVYDPQIGPTIIFKEYDWERCSSSLTSELLNNTQYPNLIIASDTIYNEYLIPHFVHCIKMNLGPNTLAIVGVQLRDDSILEAFLDRVVSTNLNLYSVPPSLLSDKLKRGFAIYCITTSFHDTQ